MSTASQETIHVLHVDDEPSFTDLTTTFLEREDEQFSVETATSADDALETIKDRPPDCVVSDYNMPGMDGLEFLQAVREVHPDFPFILFTGKGSEAVASDAISAGVTDYLQKSSGSEQYELLAKRIRNAVRGRRNAEKATRQEHLMRLTELVGDTGGFELDRERGTFLLTAGTRRIIGRPDQHEIPLEEALELFYPDDREDIQQTLDRVFETGDEIHTTWRLQSGDGESRLLDLTITPVVENGEVAKLRGVCHDITDRKKREQQLQQNRDLMANMEELADAGAWEYDAETDRLMITDGTRRIYGLDTDEDLTLEAALDAVHPDDRNLLADRFNNCLETGEPYKIEVRLPTPDRGQRWLTAQCERVSHSEDGSVIRGYIRDITEQKAHERNLKRYRTVFDELPDPVVVYDEEGRYDLVNDAATEILDTTREELAGTKSQYLEQIRAENTAGYEALVEGSQDTLRADLTDEFPGRGTRTLQCNLSVVTAEEESADTVIVTRDVTERKRREDQLRRRTQAIDEAPVGVSITDPDQDDNPLIYVNDAFVEMTGYSRDEILGENCRFLQGEETDPDRVARIRGAIDAHDPVSITLRNYRKDGTEFWNHLEIAPVRNDTGEVVNYIGFQQDITDRKERKRELQNERNRFQSIFNDAFDAMVIADDEGQYIDMNERATELFGLPQEELVGKSIQDFAPEGFDFETAWQEFQQSQRDRDTFRLARPDGTERIVEYSASTNIVPGQHLSVLRDVTDRRRRERRFRALVEESNDIIAVVDTDGSYQYVGPSIERILGYDSAEIIGESAWEPVHPEDRAELIETFEYGIADPDASPVVEYRVRHADGSWHWMEAHGNNQLDNPAVEGYVVNVRDITERRERQQQSELLDRVLRHNLRNDLNVIRARAEIIHRRATNMIASSAEQIIETSDRLIDTAEKEREMVELLQEPPSPEEYTLEPLLRDVVSSLRSEYPDATVAVDCDEEDVTIQATKKFRQAIRELVTNAIVHNDSDSPAVTVTVVQTAEDVRIEIADTGPRIPEIERDIFVGNEERTQLDHGTGLGLRLVQLLISRSGGSITFEENSPTGNIVVLELPE